MTRTAPVDTDLAAPTRPARIALWDNTRLVLVVLVVFGHSIESLRSGSPLTTAVYDVIYAFHMPAFLLVSGWFARADRLDAKSLSSTARLVVTWLLAEAGWAGIRWMTGQDPFPSDFLVLPSWTLWFLVALACMRLLLPYVARLRHPLLVTTAASLAVGMSPVAGSQFSASRTVAMLPFFVLGWHLRQSGLEHRTWFRSPSTPVRLLAGALLAAGTGAVLLATRLPAFTDQLLFWRRGYAAMDLVDSTGIVLRFAFLLLGATMTVALLVLIPRRRLPVSALGANTMAVYLLHTVLIRTFRHLRLDDAISAMPCSLGLLLLIAVAVTLLLASPPVARAMRPITEARWTFARPSTS